MRRRWRSTRIRARLTVAFAATMAVVLAATGAFVYLRLQAGLDDNIDSGLRARTDDVASLLGATGRLAPGRAHGLADRGQTFAQVLSSPRRVAGATAGAGDRPLIGSGRFRVASARPTMVDRAAGAGGEGSARLLASPVRSGGHTYVVVVGAELEQRDETLSTLAAVLAVGGLAALALSSVAGYGVAARALRPVESMRRAASDISGSDPGRRLPVPASGDEIGRLGTTLNQMLERQGAALERERRLVGDASHELRTPLAILLGEVELARRSGRSPEALRDAVTSIGEEAARLQRLVGDLTLLARSDRRGLLVDPEPLAAAGLIEHTRARFARRVADAGRAIETAGAASADWVWGDPTRIEQALANLVENALVHGRGTITLATEATASGVTFCVRDEGAGLPDDMRPVAFDRFTQADPARSGGGSGLGLSIVAAIATAHGGRHGLEKGAGVWFSIPASRQSGERKVDRPTMAS